MGCKRENWAHGAKSVAGAGAGVLTLIASPDAPFVLRRCAWTPSDGESAIFVGAMEDATAVSRIGERDVENSKLADGHFASAGHGKHKRQRATEERVAYWRTWQRLRAHPVHGRRPVLQQLHLRPSLFPLPNRSGGGTRKLLQSRVQPCQQQLVPAELSVVRSSGSDAVLHKT